MSDPTAVATNDTSGAPASIPAGPSEAVAQAATPGAGVALAPEGASPLAEDRKSVV